MKDKRLLKALGITAGVLALSVGAVLGLTLGLKNPGDTITNTDTTSYVKVDEIWDSENKTFNAENSKLLMSYLNNAEINSSNILNLSQVTKHSYYIRKNTYNSKTTSQDIIVRLGGLDWQVMYLTTNNNGDAVVSLWLSNNQQEAWADSTVYTQDMGEYYGFYEGGLYSDWSSDWADSSVTVAYPSSMYGTSYIRAITLNNGGVYAVDKETLSAPVEKDIKNPFALFTMEEYGLTDYIVKPKNMPYQLNEQASKSLLTGTGYTDRYHSTDYPNDAAGVLKEEAWQTGMNLSQKEGYFNWVNDYIWLPSSTEAGGSRSDSQGIWKSGSSQLINSSVTTISGSEKVGSKNQYGAKNGSPAIKGNTWLRSGSKTSANSSMVCSSTSPTITGNVLETFAVRPCLHLNIFDIAKDLNLLDFEYRTHSDYFTDYNISTSMDSIASTTITGSGVEDDPYIINSTNDFIFLSYQSIENTYVKLNSDIRLNDETFDENGYPTSGDNLVYQWKPINGWDGVIFDGQGHTIYGLYISQGDLNDNGALFGKSIQVIQNLNLEGFYIYQRVNVSVLCYNADTIKNCTLKHGSIQGEKNVSSFATKVREIIDCDNYASVTRKNGESAHYNSASGLVNIAIEAIRGCNNYGSVTSEIVNSGSGSITNGVTKDFNGCVAGLCIEGQQGSNLFIENSNNYGNLQGGAPVAGIIAINSYSSFLTMRNTNNYGKFGSGGLVGFARTILLDRCVNIVASKGGTISLIGTIGSNSTSGYKVIDAYVMIKDCQLVNNTGAYSVINRAIYVNSLELNIDGVTCDSSGSVSIKNVILTDIPNLSSINVRNLYIKNWSASSSYGLFNQSNKKAYIRIQNLYVEQTGGFGFRILYSKSKDTIIEGDGVLAVCTNYNKKTYYYYGTDFSGFYVSDKTGEIGIKALSGAGQFQTTLTEEELIKRGYKKGNF